MRAAVAVEKKNSCPGASWEKRGDGKPHCSHCGSIDVASVLVMLVSRGTRYSGSDWKYGWPHKFYLEGEFGHQKFYASHLTEATDDELALWNRLAQGTVEVRYLKDGERFRYVSPFKDYQAAGTVGGTREFGNVPGSWFEGTLVT